MELRRDSPMRRKRIVPSGVVMTLGGGGGGGSEKKAREEERAINIETSPFDAVLAAATISSDVGRSGPVRIAPNSVVPISKPTLPVRKRVSKVTSVSNPVVVNRTETDQTCTIVKVDKGLRHFSMRVSAKVEEKGATTYNEVADELVHEIGREIGKCDHKNIRRRVYDALNVLMAIDVIRKDKKEIRWLGLPNEVAAEMRQLDETITGTERRIKEKRKTLSELVHRLAALKNLINRNSALYNDENAILSLGTSTATNTSIASNSDKLQLPFILINAPRDCRVHCEMLEDRSQYFFEFDSPFLINEDIELLRLMGLDQVSEPDLQSWLPTDAISFLRESTHPIANTLNTTVTDIPLDIGGVLELDEWDSHGIDNFLESMPPPAIGGLAGFSMSDFGPTTLSSPVRGTSSSLGRRVDPLPLTHTIGNSNSRPLRPFRQASNNLRNRNIK